MTQGLVLIPARGGSTRVPNKNIRILGDKPLVGHVVSAAVASGVGRVIVSTNSEEIAAYAREFGAETPFLRPEILSHETASSISALLHALKWLRDEDGWRPDMLAFCPPTNPFTRAETIRDMFEMLERASGINSVVTIKPPTMHPFSLVQMGADGRLLTNPIIVDGRHANNVERSQDHPEFWQRTGNCSLTRCRFFSEVFGENYEPDASAHIQTFDTAACVGYQIDAEEGLDIDTLDDWQRAEAVLARHAQKRALMD